MTTHTGKNLRINSSRLWDSLMEMAKIGPGVAGGNNRQTLTDEDAAGRSLFQEWCLAAGCTMGLDQMGNMFATRPGTDPDALPVYMGSHLDTQPTGGKYDGVLGVLAGLEVIRTLNDLDIQTKHPIVVTNWTNEEGTRFAPAILASGVFSGLHDVTWAHDCVDAKGLRFGDELARIGWLGDEVTGARKMHAYFELHIEQGPILEAESNDIGVVTHAAGLRWIECRITGKESHTGTTPMPLRKDASLGLARLTELVHQVAMKHQPDAVAAIGHVEIHPNSRNIIAGGALCTIDMRTHRLDILEAMEAEICTRAPQICAEIGLTFEAKVISQYDPLAFDPACIAAVRDAANKLGYSHRDIISGAGHDACHINEIVPTAMIFCPCIDGLSHNEAEEILPEWAAAGTDVLLHAVLDTAGVVDV